MSLQPVMEEQIVMPFPDYETIDSERAERILGVPRSTLNRMIHAKFFSSLQLRPNSRHRIHYWSLVAFCDALRERFAIPDRRPPLMSSAARYPDDQVLPFPMADTVGIRRVMDVIDQNNRSVRAKLESGMIECYKFADDYEWRISKASLQAYIERSSRVARAPSRRYS